MPKIYCSLPNCFEEFSTELCKNRHFRDDHKLDVFCPIDGCYIWIQPNEYLRHHQVNHFDWKGKCPTCKKRISWLDMKKHINKVCPMQDKTEPKVVLKNIMDSKPKVISIETVDLKPRFSLDAETKPRITMHTPIQIDPNILDKKRKDFPTMDLQVSLHQLKPKLKKINSKNERSHKKTKILNDAGLIADSLICQFKDCNKSFSTATSRKKHETNVHSVATFECTYEGCNSVFKNKVYLGKHLNNVHAKAEVKCEMKGCFKIFKNKMSLNKHVGIVHKNKDDPNFTFKCEFENCTKSFDKKTKLTKHVWGVHNTSKKQCEICNKFLRVGNFYKHRGNCKKNQSQTSNSMPSLE